MHRHGACKIFVFSALLATFSLSAEAQRRSRHTWPSELWHEGKLVLVEGDTLRGLIKYDFGQNLVQYVVNKKKAEIFHAQKVLFVEIFDATVHKYRKFFALPYSNTSNYKAPVLFELLAEGKMTLLARELLEYKTVSNGFYGGTYSRLVQTDYYYLLKEDGTIETLRGKKSELLSLMGNKGKAVDKYIRSNRLDFDDKYDVGRIVAYYNSLAGT